MIAKNRRAFIFTSTVYGVLIYEDDLSTLDEEGANFPLNVCNQLPDDAASHNPRLHRRQNLRTCTALQLLKQTRALPSVVFSLGYENTSIFHFGDIAFHWRLNYITYVEEGHWMCRLILCKFSKWPTWRTINLFYNRFITVLYMFRATSCLSSGGQIVLIQHLVSSLPVSGRPMHRTTTYRERRYQMLY